MKRHYYLDSNNEEVGINALEGELLRHLWDADTPQSSLQLFEAVLLARKQQQREMVSPSFIEVTLLRMSQQGLLTMERDTKSRAAGGGKGYYAPTINRAEVAVAALEADCLRLTGKPMGYFLSRLNAPADNDTAGADRTDADMEALLTALRELVQDAGSGEG